MAIQLPKIQRNDVYDTSSPLPEAQAIGAEAGFNLAEGRIKMVDAVDKGLQNRQKADEKFQLEAQKAVEDARKTRVKSLANEYNMKVDKLSADFSSLPLGGDLTPQYEELVKQKEQIKKEAIDQAYDNDTLALLNSELLAQDAVLNKGIEVKRAQARVAFETQTTKDSNDIAKRNFISSSTLFNPNDVTSYKDMDGYLLEIEKNSLRYADSMGFLKDYTGKPIEPPKELKQDIKNQQSDSIKFSVMQLANANEVSRAQAVFNRYSNFLSEGDKTLVQEKLKGAVTNKTVDNITDDVLKEDEASGRAIIDSIPDLKIREMVDKKVSGARSRQRESANRVLQQQENKILEVILERSGTNPFETFEELKNARPELFSPEIMRNPTIKNRINAALNQRPYETDFDQYDRVIDAIGSGEAQKWSYQELMKNTDKIAKKEFNKINTKLTAIKSNVTLANGLKANQAKDISSKVKLALTGSTLLPSKKGTLTLEGRKNWALVIDNEVDAEIAKLKPDDITPAKMAKTIDSIVNKVYSSRGVKKGEAAKEKAGTMTNVKTFLNNLWSK